ncbi:hypothetical protein Patl1_34199 [Pistacia atlantica]|uniref:Uncharacterized protein n=1 Tax=Pistacia atlantica TaxID=434234 RepID=A0ACC0ZS51_9ROSI|nr:hypothetical protein Patl1_34199 [Pistacia atlantica]
MELKLLYKDQTTRGQKPRVYQQKEFTGDFVRRCLRRRRPLRLPRHHLRHLPLTVPVQRLRRPTLRLRRRVLQLMDRIRRIPVPLPAPNGLPPGAIAGLVVGVVIGGAIVLAAVGIFVLFTEGESGSLQLKIFLNRGPKVSGLLSSILGAGLEAAEKYLRIIEWCYGSIATISCLMGRAELLDLDFITMPADIILWSSNFPDDSSSPPADYKGPMLPKPTPPPGIAPTPVPVSTDGKAPSASGSLGADKPFHRLPQGGFGYVHKGVLPNGKVVAIKQLKAGSGQGEREFQAEVEIISRVHHRHLVTLVGYCISGAQRLLVYEFVPNKTLEFHLHGDGRPTMDWPTRMKIALGSARGLAYLHEDFSLFLRPIYLQVNPRIIHRDIKCANILIDNSFEAKFSRYLNHTCKNVLDWLKRTGRCTISSRHFYGVVKACWLFQTASDSRSHIHVNVADFGLAKYSLDTDTHVSTRVMGTFGYLAPEYAASGKLTEKSDVFSFGVLLLELITGLRPSHRNPSFDDDSMVDWAKPLLAQALEEGNFGPLVDPKLKEYDSTGMARMVACAAASVRHSARRRPRISQIVRALEGNMPLEDLNDGITPGHSSVYGSYGSLEYNSIKYREDMKKSRKAALEILDLGSSEFSGQTSDDGPNQS